MLLPELLLLLLLLLELPLDLELLLLLELPLDLELDVNRRVRCTLLAACKRRTRRSELGACRRPELLLELPLLLELLDEDLLLPLLLLLLLLLELPDDFEEDVSRRMRCSLGTLAGAKRRTRVASTMFKWRRDPEVDILLDIPVYHHVSSIEKIVGCSSEQGGVRVGWQGKYNT